MTTSEPQAPQPFDEMLAELIGGTINDKLTADLADLIEACGHHRKKGTITLKLTITPGSDGVVMQVKPSITTVLPKEPEPNYPMFADGNRLTTDHPMNKKLPFKKVENE